METRLCQVSVEKRRREQLWRVVTYEVGCWYRKTFLMSSSTSFLLDFVVPKKDTAVLLEEGKGRLWTLRGCGVNTTSTMFGCQKNFVPSSVSQVCPCKHQKTEIPSILCTHEPQKPFGPVNHHEHHHPRTTPTPSSSRSPCECHSIPLRSDARARPLGLPPAPEDAREPLTRSNYTRWTSTTRSDDIFGSEALGAEVLGMHLGPTKKRYAPHWQSPFRRKQQKPPSCGRKHVRRNVQNNQRLKYVNLFSFM